MRSGYALYPFKLLLRWLCWKKLGENEVCLGAGCKVPGTRQEIQFGNKVSLGARYTKRSSFEALRAKPHFHLILFNKTTSVAKEYNINNNFKPSLIGKRFNNKYNNV
jgi:hypothetical protein